MEELKKYIDFILIKPTEVFVFDYFFLVEKYLNIKAEELCMMIGHQPRKLTTEEIMNRDPNGVKSTIDDKDPYWTDDVTIPLNIPWNSVKTVNTDENTGVFLGTAFYTFAGVEYSLLILNDCGFTIAIGSKDIYAAANS